MIDTKEIIKDGDLLYVGRFERYCESSMSGSKIKYSFAYGYFNKGVWIRERYIKSVPVEECSGKYYNDVIQARNEYLSRYKKSIESIARRCDYTVEDVKKAIKASSYNVGRISYNRLLEALKDKESLDGVWNAFCMANYTYNKTVAPEIFRRIGIVNGPTFGRFPENKNSKTFDYIHIDVGIYGVDIDKKQYIKDHIKEILDATVNYISKRKNFIKYGISVNFLRVTSLMYTKDQMLHFCFELKPLNDKDDEDSQENLTA